MWLAQRDLISGPPVSRLNLADRIRRRIIPAPVLVFIHTCSLDLAVSPDGFMSHSGLLAIARSVCLKRKLRESPWRIAARAKEIDLNARTTEGRLVEE